MNDTEYDEDDVQDLLTTIRGGDINSIDATGFGRVTFRINVDRYRLDALPFEAGNYRLEIALGEGNIWLHYTDPDDSELIFEQKSRY